MQQKRWYCSLLDIVGLLSLVCAIVALGGAVWFVGIVSEPFLFQTFHACLVGAVGCLLTSRLAEIFSVIANTPDPKRLRSAADKVVPTSTTLALVESDKVAQGDFSRAA